MLEDAALKLLPLKIKTTFIFVFCFKLHSTGRYSCITAPQLHFYSQHLTRLTNIQTNIQARLELTKQGLQSFFEGHPYKLKQNFPSQTYREWFIKLCACGPNSAASNEVPAIDSSVQCTWMPILPMHAWPNFERGITDKTSRLDAMMRMEFGTSQLSNNGLFGLHRMVIKGLQFYVSTSVILSEKVLTRKH